ncbi:MAG: hypothetical protein JNK75_00460 [Betaproteobacteria bacterium]|nr:hypothetical protein [Betaproteobacteria bacterium]
MPGPFRRATALLAAILLLLAAWHALRLGSASWMSQELDKDLNQWAQRTDQTGLPPTLAEWQGAMDDLKSALARDPNDPSLAEIEARLLSLIVRTGDGVTSRQQEAIPALERAVALRPTSPYSWANLAAALYGAGQVNARFHAALQNAVAYGPYEREALFVVIDLGLALGETAPESTVLAVQTALKSADRREAPIVASIAQRRGKLELVCGLPNTRKQPACTAE